MVESRLTVQSGVKPRFSLGNVMSSTQVMIARMAWALGAGLSFGGDRDYYKVFGWKRTPGHVDYVTKYLKQDITQRVINAPVKALWTDQPHLEGGPRFNKAWKELVDDHQVALYYNISRADIFAGLGMFSLLLIGIDDGLALSQPVNKSRKNKVLYMQPYMEASIEILKLDDDTASPRFGKPLMYRITPGESLMKNATTLLNAGGKRSFDVHYSRVLHMADNCMENTVIGHSRLEPIYNLLDDLQKVSGGSAETYWLTANRGLQVDVDKDMELEGDDADALADEVDEYEHGVRRVLRTRGVKITNLGSDVADPRGPFNVLIALLAANTGIPQRVLIGAEAGQLASQQDRANWAVQVRERASHWGEPKVVKPLVFQLVDMNVLPPPKNFEVIWPEPFKMSPLERGQTSAQQARSATNVARAMQTAQAIGIDLISQEEAREMVAPGDKLLELTGPISGTVPPKLKAPVQDPQNKLDEIDAQTEADIKKSKEAPPPAPFGGSPNPNNPNPNNPNPAA